MITIRRLITEERSEQAFEEGDLRAESLNSTMTIKRERLKGEILSVLSYNETMKILDPAVSHSKLISEIQREGFFKRGLTDFACVSKKAQQGDKLANLNNDHGQKYQMKNNVRDSEDGPVVFLAAPISCRFDPTTDTEDVALKNTLVSILEILKKYGYKIRSAHVREDWGKKLMEPRVFVALDYRWIKESDLIIAYVDGTSSGLYVEIGWASLLSKDILILHKEGTHFSPMILGLESIDDSICTRVQILSFKDGKDLTEKLEPVLKNRLE
jgi:nucleoside 2-deoxyribosyltransferase